LLRAHSGTAAIIDPDRLRARGNDAQRSDDEKDQMEANPLGLDETHAPLRGSPRPRDGITRSPRALVYGEAAPWTSPLRNFAAERFCKSPDALIWARLLGLCSRNGARPTGRKGATLRWQPGYRRSPKWPWGAFLREAGAR